MRPQMMVNAFIEHIEGNLAVISVGQGRGHLSRPGFGFPQQEKKYLILLRRFMPPAAKEGLSLRIQLGQEGMKKASFDLEKTIKDAKLFNEVMDYMRQTAG